MTVQSSRSIMTASSGARLALPRRDLLIVGLGLHQAGTLAVHHHIIQRDDALARAARANVRFVVPGAARATERATACSAASRASHTLEVILRVHFALDPSTWRSGRTKTPPS